VQMIQQGRRARRLWRAPAPRSPPPAPLALPHMAAAALVAAMQGQLQAAAAVTAPSSRPQRMDQRLITWQGRQLTQELKARGQKLGRQPALHARCLRQRPHPRLRKMAQAQGRRAAAHARATRLPATPVLTWGRACPQRRTAGRTTGARRCSTWTPARQWPLVRHTLLGCALPGRQAGSGSAAVLRS